MKLINIFDNEEKLLTFEKDNKFKIPFNDYIILDEILNEIGIITNKYFNLINEYNDVLLKKGLTYDERRNIIEAYNKDALNEDISINIEKLENFKKKYNI